MLDLERIRKEPEWLDNGLKKRGLEPLSAQILDLDQQRRALQTRLQTAQAESNKFAKEIGMLMGKGDKAAAEAAKAHVAELKKDITAATAEEEIVAEKLNAILTGTPNVPDDDIPLGKDENDNVRVAEFLSPTKFQFNDIKDHVALGEGNGLIDFPTAVKMAGSRFVVMKGAIAKLERALANFGLDMLANEYGYTEVQAPLMVNDDAAYGTAQLPKFAEDLFKTNTGHWLISTSEMSMTNLFLDTISNESDLPIRLTSYTPCFRSEAGSAGRDTRGMIRVHQFNKVEQVVITTPDKSDEELERMTSIAEEGLKRLKLPYEKVFRCAGDIGFSAKRSYDINTWVPSQNTYRETMSCSNCGDFQARRMKARYKPEGSKKTEFVHTLNATLFATGRAIVAIMENYQQQDGSIKVPDVLVPYMNGLDVIRK